MNKKQFVPLFDYFISNAYQILLEANKNLAKCFDEPTSDKGAVILNFSIDLYKVKESLESASKVNTNIETFLTDTGLIANLMKIQEASTLIRNSSGLCDLLMNSLSSSEIEEYQLTQISELKLGVDALNVYWKDYMHKNVEKHATTECKKN